MDHEDRRRKPKRFTRNIQPKQCYQCRGMMPVDSKALILDIRCFTEDGWLPLITDTNLHELYVFCSKACLAGWAVKACEPEVIPDEEDKADDNTQGTGQGSD